MSSLLAIGILSGVLLGLRYKVLIFVPGFLIACSLITIGGAIMGIDLAAIGLASLIVTVALQVGYACGLGLRFVFIMMRTTRFQHAMSVPAATPITSRH
jgi:hypothetical protein